MTKVFESVSSWIDERERLRACRSPAISIGFVPTMGALHDGHLSLVSRSRSENEVTLVSIFVNPTQFNDPGDYQNYPRTLETDLAKLQGAGCDYLLLPKYNELYGDRYRYQVQENEFSRLLCGAHRPGHFTGVLTVVMKLLNIAGAQRAYFGEKDFQQLQLIKDMAQAFFMPVDIVPCPTKREGDGLAMSSRNVRLTAEERKQAALFPELLKTRRSAAEIRAELERVGFRVDYVEDHFARRFGAVHLGKVRLIDNVEI